MRTFEEVLEVGARFGFRFDRNGYVKLSFKTTERDPETGEVFKSECSQVPGHTITRTWSWKRLGGAQYDFNCSCGWTGCSGQAGKSNRPAQQHIAGLLRRAEV